ncbi:MAG: metal-dependent transcriptional regulator [Promethearchaeota archaeon]
MSEQKNPAYRGVTVRDQEYPESYDEYLEIIYRLSLSNPAGIVKNKTISTALNVKASSVTNMLEKLKDIALIEWTPRSVIKLTKIGRTRAKELIKYNILTELFLCRVLKITNPTEINRIACDFEHHFNPELAERFVQLLGIDSTEFPNIDNFIMENKIPIPIHTKPVYSSAEMDIFLKEKKKLLTKQLAKNINLSKNQKEKVNSILEDILNQK